ncbi:ATP-dependent DNA helicase CHL1 [Hypsizygus marmoreus]|uniref:ATP-dependent DNA helicase CHL1 n=1 Tax=Hypsizygus marmoreus TaxID=39966 RepID=A0A369J9B8_HYPMA|nr:ATP-dependent DNA helicase CHL1 [Hypsizygus marmoreus]
MSLNLDLPTPDDFPAFPFNPPYEIQVELMRHLYSSLEEKKVTIVESPTGTGKTLSLLCASLTWLRDEKDRAKKGKLKAITEDGCDAKDWVVEQTRERVRRELEADEQEYEERLIKARKREAAMRKTFKARVVKKAKHDGAPPQNEEDDDQFLPEDESLGDDEEMNISPALRALMAKSVRNFPSLLFSSLTQSTMHRVDKAPRTGLLNGDVEPTCTKIYYASRTHSQLTQILPELRRLKLSPHICSHHSSLSPSTTSGHKRPADALEDDDLLAPCTRTVSLGSRKQLCINENLRARSRDLDESCRELLGEKGDKRCQYLPPMDEATRMLDFRDQILASPKDIEDLATAGRMAQTCPYFGARRAIPQAEVVTLPYNLLLQKSAREALGIDLTDQIVIIDEAHNLIPTLLSLSTTRLPYATLVISFQQVCTYVSNFRNRLGAGNMLHLKRLVVFLDALRKCVSEWKEARIGKAVCQDKGNSRSSENDKVEVMTVAELLERLGRRAAGVNLLEIEAYLKRSKVARKIAGYSDKEATKNSDIKHVGRGAIPPLHIVEAFMLSLTERNEDGRVTFSLVGTPGNEEVELKYQLLNPSPPFRDIVDAARSVVLAGGTMSPMSDVVNQLFLYLSPERLTSFSCGHIIPSSNLQTMVVSKGPRGGELEYKAGRQSDANVIAELGQILLNFAGMVPAGLIVFFPSYNFLNTAKTAWKTSGVLDKLGLKKKTFFEPTETTDVDKVLQEYSEAVKIPPSLPTDKRRGALLFAVIGAKLSEGLNFADDLARAVVIVGLPFANLGSPELRERMSYVKRLEEKRPTKREPGQKDAAAELYENMCMNAVNQSIGRAIRHQRDWASLILLDRRYASTSIRNKLPKWIGSGITVTDGFGPAIKGLATFYKSKRECA